MKTLRTISRLIVGLVFIFSGFVKAVDPLGSTYKFTDYFNAFGMHGFAPLALYLAFLLSAIELVMGIGLLLSYRMKTVSWAVLLFMSFFTVLTFILAIFNPVTDCGCFGDALIITNWQTFWKNVLLMVFTLLIFTGRNSFPVVRNAYTEWGVLSFFFAAVLGLSLYCKNHLPILDFMPYKIGVNIPAATTIPRGAPTDVYETRLFYKNLVDGKTSEFGMDNFPKDTLWKFVDSKSVLISKGYEAPIHDFSIAAPNGEDLTSTIKNDPGFVFLLVSYNIPKANKEALRKASDYFKLSGLFRDVRFYAVTSSLENDIKTWRDSLGLTYDFGSADEIALKTIIRANPGLLLIRDGTIIGKWHYNDFPDVSDLGSELPDRLASYPMATGADLLNLKTPPEGTRSDIYSTSLVYRKISNDSTASFSMDNFPQNGDWAFVSSHSEKTSSGFVSPLEGFKMLTPEGIDISEKILQQKGDAFLIFVKEPENLDIDLLDRLNKLSMVSAALPQGPYFFYAVTGLASDQIYGFTDSYITPITFCSGSPDFINSVAGKGVSLIHLKDGKIIDRWDNASIPGPAEFTKIVSEPYREDKFETYIMPYLFSHNRMVTEKNRVYLLIFGFFFIALFIRLFFENPFMKK